MGPRFPWGCHGSSLSAAALAICSVLPLPGLGALDAVRVDPATGHFVDSHGRVRIFHGVNVVYKVPPWYPPSDRFTPSDSLDPVTMEKLHEWGFNAVRLGVMWPGVEPRRGAYDLGYLDAIKNLTDLLAEHGVYTIADLHQDVGSRRFCGEGFPEHYIDELLEDPGSRVARAKPFPGPVFAKADFPMNSSGFPALSDCLKHEFARYYETEQVSALWNELYTPGTHLHEGFVKFWSVVASAFKGVSQILAYELLNEPSGFCISEDCNGGLPDVLPEVFGNKVEVKKLTPLYQLAARAIRAAGAPQPILYEPTPLPKVGEIFPAPVLGDDPQQGVAYHIYCQPGDGRGPVMGTVCMLAQGIFENTYFKFLLKHPGVASFMTEFGAVGGNAAELEHMNHLLAAADQHLQSWAYWQLKKYEDFTTANSQESLYDSQGRLNVPKLKTLSRTYAPATAGEPLRMFFDPDSAVFELDFNATLKEVPTEIYFNEALYYENGYDVKVTPTDCVEVVKPEKNRLLLTLTKDECLNQLLRVNLTAKRPRTIAQSLLLTV